MVCLRNIYFINDLIGSLNVQRYELQRIYWVKRCARVPGDNWSKAKSLFMSNHELFIRVSGQLNFGQIQVRCCSLLIPPHHPREIQLRRVEQPKIVIAIEL